MPHSSHVEAGHEVEQVQTAPQTCAPAQDELRACAKELARELAWLPSVRSSNVMTHRCRAMSSRLRSSLQPFRAPLEGKTVSEDYRWLHDNMRLADMELHSLHETINPLRNVPYVHTAKGQTTPRVVAVAEGYLAATKFKFSEITFRSYIEAFQQITVLNLKELTALVAALKVRLLEEIADRASRLLSDKGQSVEMAVCITSLRDVIQAPWKDVLEPLVLFDRILRQDPVGAYSRMDYDSRELYRKKVAKIARYSDVTETQVASEALALSREAQSRPVRDPRLALRQSHIGYYLLAEGNEVLLERVGFRFPLSYRIPSFLRKHPDEFYLPAIATLTLAIMSVIVLVVTNPSSPPALVLLAMLALLLPSSQSAIQVVNYLTTSLLRPQILPKLDFSEGIPDDCFALVAVPTLLLNEEQVRGLIDDLEVRFLGNHDRNLAFALLSDLPDSRHSPHEDSPLIALCVELIRGLNEKYASQGGSFLQLHRHRVYNPREKVWMGWERKRGKLMDLNKLLRGEHDSFPVKTGDLSVLSKVRFVITLDSDTELPRDTAQRMVGTLAHPLNQAIIDPERNIVVAGYGILQPRVGVSVQSAARSRLAAIYSGETGFDIYTRAVSDVYQDLYGEATYAGKGIYEVETLHRVLDRRFPRNALLSHDLIEGAYARAGLISDVEIIEDYPSHYSAYNRRKHRWLRGDWQIAGWLGSLVPDESGKWVPNQMSLVSQWKILDNLRRSLVEPATLLLLVLGWVVLPGRPLYWTLATVAILFIPAWCRFVFELVRAAIKGKAAIAREATEALFDANINVLLTLSFLAHQMLVSIDAVVRTLVRRMVTRERLLQWETAAEVELGQRERTPLDVYLEWTPAVAIGLGLLVWYMRQSSIFVALPILLLWAGSKLISVWLNRPPRSLHQEVSRRDRRFLRGVALRTWRYFAEFSTEEHHWLIPDNVQEEPCVVAARISPTNLGMLLNARQVACQFGFLTVPEFAEHTRRTLTTVASLERYRGHLLNWYNTRTLAPLAPRFVSSVDSGNLLTSLWTLQQGSLAWLDRPVLSRAPADGLLEHLRSLADLGGFSRKKLRALERSMTRPDWLQHLLGMPETAFSEGSRVNAKRADDAHWFRKEAESRFAQIKETVRLYTPWLLPEFAKVREDLASTSPSAERLRLRELPEFIDRLIAGLESNTVSANGHGTSASGELLVLLREARLNAVTLIKNLNEIADTAGRLADEMDFQFILDRRRKLLSIGFDVDAQQLHAACYDLLASEARIAAFVAIAKDDIPQETWFKLGRVHTIDHGRQVLLSWTGTMFEYLMPSLWMRSYSGTLLERSRVAAVRAQQAYVAARGIPWGISESAYAKRDDAGNYHYYAFGVPNLALKEAEVDALVISPYSTFLALHVDAPAALRNLREMARRGWCATRGYYEAADFTPLTRSFWRQNHQIVRCWMAHHQGMSLLSIANFLCDGIVQQWFHGDPRVQATELLLHEKPVAHLRPVRGGYGTAAA